MIQVNGLKEHRENRDSTRNENDYSNLPLRKSENGKTFFNTSVCFEILQA